MKGIPFLKKDIGKISAIIDSIDMLSDNSYTWVTSLADNKSWCTEKTRDLFRLTDQVISDFEHLLLEYVYPDDVQEYLEEIEKNLSSYSNMTLVFMDVNHMKLVNDTHGHNAGDELIIAASRCIEKSFGSIGSCFRIGGDEFCAVLPDTSLTEKELSGLLDEELRTYNQISGRYHVSLARGISRIRDDNGNLKTVSDWKREADLKMYDNKGWVKRTENGGKK